MTFFGYQAGRILISYQSHKERCLRWIIWGLIFIAIGTGLCGGSKEGGLVPLNKNMWSVSFIFLLAGLAFLILTFLYFWIDVRKCRTGWPFKEVGMNSIAIYLMHEVFSGYFPLSFVNDGSHHMMLLSNVIGVAVWVSFAVMMR